ncbi:NAD-binding protein [Actinomycetospora endophytica]|uniref:Trk system potassium uptake protein TrkA n=1 Tax=Actinomycetospora endophytica TaxID=2291215 RepID=A0ABS8P6F2_9PSEU|nr:NAD-binding protein [Actinomycetospora endophytica]MCD2193825.1 NAD-binding protein [Actinomycetospora endophytica]
MTSAGSTPSARPRRFVICGENLLTLRIVEALRRQGSAAVDIVVVVADRAGRYVPQIEDAGVRVLEGGSSDDDRTFLAAGVRGATAVALVDREDVTNIHRALRVQEIDPDVRLVVRLFNTRLGRRIEQILPTATVLSVSETAAPSFVAQAIGRNTRQHIRVPERTFVVAGRREVRDEAVVCGLAANSQLGARGGPRLLPAGGPDAADYVLAVAESRARETDQLSRPRTERVRNAVERVVVRLRGTFTRRLARATLALGALFILGTVAFATAGGYHLGDAIYLAVLDSAGAAQPDTGASVAVRVIQGFVTVIGIAIIPLVTAVVVESAVSGRVLGTTPRRMPRRDHVVVVGLGNVGMRIVTTLRDRGVPVVAVERSEGAVGASTVARAGIPVILGDATRERVLREAGAEECRALVAVTSDDATNLQAALVGRSVQRSVRVVLRLRDDDLAGRVERSMDAISRSVSYVAAPVFAAALRDGQVVATIPIGRRILLMAEVAVGRASFMAGLPIPALSETGAVRVVGVYRGAGPDAVLETPPRPHRRLKVGDRLLVVATRGGLGTVLERCASRSVYDRAAVPSRRAEGMVSV